MVTIPAYDVTLSYKLDSTWVNAHQMLINGKADDITKEDILKVAERADIKKSDAINIIEQVRSSVSKWSDFAEESTLSEQNTEKIKRIISI